MHFGYAAEGSMIERQRGVVMADLLQDAESAAADALLIVSGQAMV